ncbi:hypothetical protein E5Q_00123 [Mixia osmundae IAM 14324]|uniref:SHSP domain-containing protein n=1 Tax=Mixia osmundae (strain CBS 9802 / IAM 14324 / JCM 22182 / KY 12970) TaxID=764103 RepID=G7DSC2_MIXOS|nr:hypothetical protein E5Q_00123 [Mixia osmundae IAM 14324]
MSSPQLKRKIDICIYGATGYTGKLTAKYLAEHADGAKIALGGRSKAKLESVAQESGLKDAKIYIADSDDEAALLKMVKDVKVVITLVGPYARYGNKLIKVCAEAGTHYLDLTAEATWVAQKIQQHHKSSMVNRAIIVHSCGFDSVPSDLGTLLAVQLLKRIRGPATSAGRVRTGFKVKGSISGGTFATAMDLLASPRELYRGLAGNAYALSPKMGKQKLRGPKVVTRESGQFGSFWFMGPYNTALVRRTWGILEATRATNVDAFSYGRDMTYDEYMTWWDPVSATLFSLFFMLFSLIVMFPPFRLLAQKVGPQSGSGPSEKQNTDGWFKTHTFAHSADGKTVTEAVISGKGDPGYALTALMLSECALCIIHDYADLPSLAHEGGPLTPSTAFGNVLVDRLQKTGKFTFSAEEYTGKKKAGSSVLRITHYFLRAYISDKQAKSQEMVFFTAPVAAVDPFEDFIGSILNQVHAGVERECRRPDKRSTEAHFTPQVDLVQTESTQTAYINLPGIPKEAVKLELRGDVVVVSGQLPRPAHYNSQSVKLSERPFGNFKKGIRVHRLTTASDIKASMANGVLKLEFPLVPRAAEPAPIAIEDVAMTDEASTTAEPQESAGKSTQEEEDDFVEVADKHARVEDSPEEA